MCELLGFSSDHPVRLDLEWVAFSARGSSACGSPDGWGAGYYQGLDAAIFREPLPAASSGCSKLLDLCAPPSRIAIAHVRRAVAGAATLANCQPFAKPLAGRIHLFAHNGFVAECAEMRTELPLAFAPVGETDSERVFGQLLHELAGIWKSRSHPSVEARYAAVDRFATRMREHGALNFIYSDGELVFAHGHRRTLPGDEISTDPGLHLLERGEGCGDAGTDAPISGLRQVGACSRQALVATVPLNDQAWVPLGHGELICLKDGARLA